MLAQASLRLRMLGLCWNKPITLKRPGYWKEKEKKAAEVFSQPFPFIRPDSDD
jgi:hypothetical protein